MVSYHALISIYNVISDAILLLLANFTTHRFKHLTLLSLDFLHSGIEGENIASTDFETLLKHKVFVQIR